MTNPTNPPTPDAQEPSMKSSKKALARLKALKPELTTAHAIVADWLENQLRPEGRAGIYVDDEAGLAYDIAEALAAAYQRGLEDAVKEAEAMGARVLEASRSAEASGRHGVASHRQSDFETCSALAVSIRALKAKVKK